MENMVASMKKFYKGKKVLITGHTGFKGSWMCEVLEGFGANVVGYSKDLGDINSIFNKNKLSKRIKSSVIADIRDLKSLQKIFEVENPEIVFHLAAQPLVIDSYEDPLYTYEVNIMGTVNILECVKKTKSVKSFLNVTTDKVYKNNEWFWPYRETDVLCGSDPYSNSKSCSELVTYSYRESFFKENNVSISTARSGNVIGGGDLSKNRIVPDILNAINTKTELILRNPNSVRPYQHVLETIYAYLLIAYKQYENKSFESEYNIGPNSGDFHSTYNIVEMFIKYGENIFVNCIENKENLYHEAKLLRLDTSKINTKLSWIPVWNLEKSVQKVLEFNNYEKNNKSTLDCIKKQILEYESELKIINEKSNNNWS